MKLRKLRLGALIAASLLAPSLGHADPIGPTPEAYVVVGNEVIEGGTHTWDFPVVITPGSSLTIKGATVYLDWRPPFCFHGTAGVCPAGLQVLGGTLRVHDSTLDTHLWEETDGWSGYKILGNAATFDLQRSRFLHQENLATQGAGLAPSIVKGNVFDQATTALRFWRGAEFEITDNTFSHMLNGIDVRDTTGLISGNRFIDAQRSWGSGISVSIQSTQVGQDAFVTDPIVENNIFDGGSRTLAILSLNGFPNVIRNNHISGFAVGTTIGLLIGEEKMEHPIVEGNVYEGNNRQLRMYVSGITEEVQPVSFAVHGNSFLGASCTDIENVDANPNALPSIDATGNWWGSSSGPAPDAPGCSRLKGDRIAVDPWLTSTP